MTIAETFIDEFCILLNSDIDSIKRKLMHHKKRYGCSDPYYMYSIGDSFRVKADLGQMNEIYKIDCFHKENEEWKQFFCDGKEIEQILKYISNVDKFYKEKYIENRRKKKEALERRMDYLKGVFEKNTSTICTVFRSVLNYPLIPNSRCAYNGFCVRSNENTELKDFMYGFIYYEDGYKRYVIKYKEETIEGDLAEYMIRFFHKHYSRVKYEENKQDITLKEGQEVKLYWSTKSPDISIAKIKELLKSYSPWNITLVVPEFANEAAKVLLLKNGLDIIMENLSSIFEFLWNRSMASQQGFFEAHEAFYKEFKRSCHPKNTR